MNGIELYRVLEDGSYKPVSVWYCSKCRIVHKTKEDADKCCVHMCSKCSKEIVPYAYRGMCDDCSRTESAKRELEKIEKAELIENDSEYIYYGDDYKTEDDLFDHFRDMSKEDLKVACEFGFYCDKVGYTEPGIVEYVREQCENDHYEEASDQLQGLDELQKAVDVFVEANKGFCSYMVDEKKKVSVKHLIDEAMKEIEENGEENE